MRLYISHFASVPKLIAVSHWDAFALDGTVATGGTRVLEPYFTKLLLLFVVKWAKAGGIDNIIFYLKKKAGVFRPFQRFNITFFAILFKQ